MIKEAHAAASSILGSVTIRNLYSEDRSWPLVIRESYVLQESTLCQRQRISLRLYKEHGSVAYSLCAAIFGARDSRKLGARQHVPFQAVSVVWAMTMGPGQV